MKKTLKSMLAIALSVAVMVTFIPLTASVACGASKAGTPKNVKCTYKELTNSSFTKGKVKISWDKSSSAKGYKVYYKAGSKYKALGTTSKNYYYVKDLKEGKTYSIKVKAYKKKSSSKTYSKFSKLLKVKVSKEELGVKAYNGNMIGTVNNGVYAYKGVHFAQDAGTPENRWQKPVPVKASNKDVDASEFGPSALQVPWTSEDASCKKQDEDCLTLDVWTNSPNGTDAKKPVWVWIHGGAHILGGSNEPLYYGQDLIEECGDDVIFVSLNYRLNCMGIMNFSEVEGGENYKDAGWLPLYDNIEALRWIQKNIEQFGGDPNQVTIAGESAGAAQVSLLPLMEECQKEKLFNKVICQSGSVEFTTLEERSYDPTKVMMDGFQYKECTDPNEYGVVKGLGKGYVPTMKDLANLSDKEMWKLMYYCQCCTYNPDTGRAENATECAGAYNYPIRGGQDNNKLNARFSESVETMMNQYKDLDYIDLMIGSNANEYDYWIGEMSNKKDKKGNVIVGAEATAEDFIYFDYAMSASWNYRKTGEPYSTTYKEYYPEATGLFERLGIDKSLEAAMDNRLAANAKHGLDSTDKISDVGKKGSTLATENAFAIPAMKIAEAHSKSKGNTYMYYWKHPSDSEGFNAGHAVELAYVFGVDSDDYFTQCCGTTDDDLMDKTLKTWVSFINDGKPTVANQDIEWPQYDKNSRKTMVVNNTAINENWTVESDPEKEIRNILTQELDTPIDFIDVAKYDYDPETKTYTYRETKNIKSYFDWFIRGYM